MRRETSRPTGPPRDVGAERSPSASQHPSQVSRLSYSPEIREAQTQRLPKLKSSLAKSGEHLQTVALLYSTSPGGGLDPDRSTQGTIFGTGETSGSTDGRGESNQHQDLHREPPGAQNQGEADRPFPSCASEQGFQLELRGPLAGFRSGEAVLVRCYRCSSSV